MAHAADFPVDPDVIVTNPDDEVTAESLRAWVDNRQSGDPIEPGVRAVDTLAEIRSIDEARHESSSTPPPASNSWRTPLEQT